MKRTMRLFFEALLLLLWISNVVAAPTNAEPGSGAAHTTAAVDVEHQHPAPSMTTTTTTATKLYIFIYETDESSSIDASSSPATLLLEQANALTGVHAVVFGQGSRFEGYASKYKAVNPLLRSIVAPDDLVVITDGRDVLVNHPAASNSSRDGWTPDRSVSDFIEAYGRLIKDNNGRSNNRAVVIGAEAQCCVSALTHALPGGYFHSDGSRKDRSCESGSPDCMWAGDDLALPWETYMQNLALDRVGSDRYDDVYLNAGLMVGTAANLAQLLDDLQMDNTEDDQAVLTDFMHSFPDRILLDYGQTMFGNNRGGLGGMEEDACMFFIDKKVNGDVQVNDKDSSSGNSSLYQRLVHTKTGTSPLFVHSPGGFLQCHDDLAAKLGLPSLSAAAQRRRMYQTTTKCKNYRKCAEPPPQEEKKKDKKDKKDKMKDEKKDADDDGEE